MMNKKIISVLSLTLVALAGCGESDKKEQLEPISAEINNTALLKVEQTDVEQALDAIDVIAVKNEKGVLWFAAFNQDFNQILARQDSEYKAVPIFDLFKNSQQVLDSLGSDKLVFSVDAIKGKRSIDLSTLSYNFKSQKDLSYINNSFEYINSVPIKINELDDAGNIFAAAYINLSQAMGELGDYFFIKETYRTDNYARGEELYNNVKEASLALESAKEQAMQVYKNIEKENYQASEKLAKEKLKEKFKEKEFTIHRNIMDAMDSVNEVVELVKVPPFSDAEEVNEQLPILLTRLNQTKKILDDSLVDSESFQREYSSNEEQVIVRSFSDVLQKMAVDLTALLHDITKDEHDKASKKWAEFYEKYLLLKEYHKSAIENSESLQDDTFGT